MAHIEIPDDLGVTGGAGSPRFRGWAVFLSHSESCARPGSPASAVWSSSAVWRSGEFPFPTTEDLDEDIATLKRLGQL